MSEDGVITNYYRQLILAEGKEKNKVIRAMFQYSLGRKPNPSDYGFLFKLVKDFGYELVFDALVSFSYSAIDKTGNVRGYLATICRNKMLEVEQEARDEKIKLKTEELVNRIINFKIKDKEKRAELLKGVYD